MADISMCPGENCERRESCYRFTAIPSEHWQSWFETPQDKPCEYYWNNEGYRKYA